MNQIDIKKIEYYVNIISIYLFGSVARGDNDEYSDIDVLIIIDDCSENEYITLKKEFAKELEIPEKWIALYQISKIRNMYKYGSYFLWHIKKEGVRLYEVGNVFSQILQELPPYINIKRDIVEYTQILYDIKEEISNDLIDVNYELAVLASVVRNSCIAIMYMNNCFDFGRTSAVEACISMFGSEIKFTIDEYKELYKYRLYQSDRTIHIKNGNERDVLYWVECAQKLLLVASKGADRLWMKK